MAFRPRYQNQAEADAAAQVAQDRLLDARERGDAAAISTWTKELRVRAREVLYHQRRALAASSVDREWGVPRR